MDNCSSPCALAQDIDDAWNAYQNAINSGTMCQASGHALGLAWQVIGKLQAELGNQDGGNNTVIVRKVMI